MSVRHYSSTVQRFAASRAVIAGRAYWRPALGFVLAMVLLFAVAEGYLRVWPPADLHQFLGDDAPISGPFAPHAGLGLAYQCYDVFEQDYRRQLVDFGPFDATIDPRPIWALFGNSFVQATGMLGDQVREQVPHKRAFYLRRNEVLLVQLAQIELLLTSGLRPERIFITLMPVDILSIGPQPLDTVLVNAKGGLTYRPRPSGLATLDWLVSRLRLATTAWLRSGRGVGNPGFNKRALYEYIHPQVLADLQGIFGYLARVTHGYQVPVTMILIPTWEQVVGHKGYSFQDTIGRLMGELGFDVFDPRQAFLAVPPVERPSLYLPDKHLSERGNRLLLQELLHHLDGEGGNVVDLSFRHGDGEIRGLGDDGEVQSPRLRVPASPRHDVPAFPRLQSTASEGMEAPPADRLGVWPS